MAHRYYTTMRPPAPGAVPKGATDFRDWGKRVYIGCGCHAWGWVEYDRQLTADEIRKYELAEVNQ